MTMDQMRFKVVTGGGNMPAYGKNLSPPEIEALVNFLETLHPANEPPAYDPARQMPASLQYGTPKPSSNYAAPANPSPDRNAGDRNTGR
jgi:ubiquinol-cytochrome c reductase cytochrome b subunit